MQRKDEHMLHNPVYCDTEIKKPQEKMQCDLSEKTNSEPPTELQKTSTLSGSTRNGQYSLAGPGIPYVIDLDEL